MYSCRFMRWCVWRVLGLLLLLFFVSGCAYRLVTGPLMPLDESGQDEGSQVSDDGTVTFHIERLRISLKPMSDAELNRQFPNRSGAGKLSTNPYTFGDWVPEGEERTPSRFTVFFLEVENYAFPKVLLHPLEMTVHSPNGRLYKPHSFAILREYYYPYNRGFAGNESNRFEARKDLFRRTMYPADEYVFSGMSQSGYVVFPKLHDDVHRIAVHLNGIALRFDYKNDPTETKDLVFHYRRDVRREE